MHARLPGARWCVESCATVLACVTVDASTWTHLTHQGRTNWRVQRPRPLLMCADRRTNVVLDMHGCPCLSTKGPAGGQKRWSAPLSERIGDHNL